MPDSKQSDTALSSAAMQRDLRRRRPWLALPAIAALVGLSSCDDGSDCCYDYGHGQNFTPYEISNGLVAGDFNHNGDTSLVLSISVNNGGQPYQGYLNTYLSTGPGAFATPVTTTDGNDPLYLASADLNGDGVVDISDFSLLAADFGMSGDPAP